MPVDRAYLDWNASAPLHPAARAAMLAAMDVAGNPSSIHAEGQAARAIIEQARADVAALVGADPDGVVFTSGAAEAANALLVGGVRSGGALFGARRIIGATEHAAILAAAGEEAEIVPAGPDGMIDHDRLIAMLGAGPPALVAVQLANNETGLVQPVRMIARIVHEAGGVLLCDAVQGPTKLFYPLPYELGDADFVVLSAHKFGGPKGVGAIVRRNARIELARPLIAGGGQERGHRGGTENVVGIAGMGAAAKAARAFCDDQRPVQAVSALRSEFEQRLKQTAANVRIIGEGGSRLANTTCFAIPGLSAQQALIALDLDGVAISSGSACSSGKVRQSHVLKAMGEPDWVLAGALRLSIGPTTTLAEIEKCLMSLAKLVKRRKAAA